MNRRTYEMYFTDEAGGLAILSIVGCDKGIRDWLKKDVFPYKLGAHSEEDPPVICEPVVCPPTKANDRLEYVNRQIDAMLLALLELKKYIAQPNA